MKLLVILILASVPAAAFAQDEIRFKDVRDLGKDVTWGALSADGKRALLAARNTAPPRFSFRVIETDTGKTTDTYDADVNMDDFLPALIRPECFSPDGTMVLYPSRSQERAPDQWGGGRIHIAREGAKVNWGVAQARSTAWFGAWSKDGKDVYFIEAGHRKDLGYSIRKVNKEKGSYETLYDRPDRLACLLRVSPDGKRLAVLDFPARDDEVRLVVLALDDKKAVESEPFRCDDLGADGVMPLHWESDRSIVFHRSPTEPRPRGSRERIHAWRYDVEKRTMTTMTEGASPFFVTAPAGEGRWLAGRQKDNSLEGLVVLPDGKTVSMPDSNLAISSGAGWWLVMDLRNRSMLLARPEWKR